jgi:hypothetical protein
VKDHVLLSRAAELDLVDAAFRLILSDERIDSIVSLIPEEWLLVDAPFDSTQEQRAAYAQFLKTRVAHSEIFVKEAQHARSAIV